MNVDSDRSPVLNLQGRHDRGQRRDIVKKSALLFPIHDRLFEDMHETRKLRFCPEKSSCYFFLTAFTVFSSCLLTACSNGEPTETAMFQAMTSADLNHQMFGNLEKIKPKMHKSGCDKVGSNTYKCGLAWKNGDGKVFPSITFVKVGGSWRLAL